MRGSSVRGTPYHHVGPGGTAHEGIKPGTPGGMRGTTPQDLAGTGINTRGGPGTPYRSQAGNGPEARRVVSSDRYGKVESGSAGDQADPQSNGRGVVFDGHNEYSRGFDPQGEDVMDSPIPRDAPRFDPDFIPREDAAHMGSGNESGARTSLVEVGGVMSRGMVGTSTSSGPETELTEDGAHDIQNAGGHVRAERE